MTVLPNPKEELFLHHFIAGMGKGEAYTAAGHTATGTTAHMAGSRMFKRPRVQKRYGELMAPAIAKAELNVERVLNELSCLAFYDITGVVDNATMKMRALEALPDELRRAIVGVKVVQVGEIIRYEYKFADKQRALDSLARHLQMFKDTLIVENVFRVVQEMDDDELDRRLTELERAFEEATTLDPPTGTGSQGIH